MVGPCGASTLCSPHLDMDFGGGALVICWVSFVVPKDLGNEELLISS